MTKNPKTTTPNNDELVTIFRVYEHPLDHKETIILTFNIPKSQVRIYPYPSKQEAYEIFLSKHKTH
jgi:hypothetical protein